MTVTKHLKPSDLVVWRDSNNGLSRRLRKLGTATRWQDRQTGKEFNEQGGNWICRVEYQGNHLLGHMDPEYRAWTLMTQGQHRGSRRYYYSLTQAEAERRGLAWLDRRFKVLLQEDEAPKAKAEPFRLPNGTHVLLNDWVGLVVDQSGPNVVMTWHTELVTVDRSQIRKDGIGYKVVGEEVK